MYYKSRTRISNSVSQSKTGREQDDSVHLEGTRYGPRTPAESKKRRSAVVLQDDESGEQILLQGRETGQAGIMLTRDYHVE